MEEKPSVFNINDETDIEKVKSQLFITNKILEGVLTDASIYKFYLGLFNMKTEFEYCENPLVSIVIPVKNEFILTQFLLNSINQYTQNIPYEVIIADDNSTDNTIHIQEFYPNVIVNKNNLYTPGFIYNVENGIEQARGEYILLLNNDMLVMENYLDELLKVIQNHSDIGIVGAKNISINNTVQECGVILENDGNTKFIGINEPVDYMDYKEYIDCDYCSGCSILFKKEIWNKIGGFDKNYAPAYYEDSDFALSVKYKLGLKSVCVPKSKIYHFKGATYIKELKQLLYIKNNKDYFLQKWGKYLNKT